MEYFIKNVFTQFQNKNSGENLIKTALISSNNRYFWKYKPLKWKNSFTIFRIPSERRIHGIKNGQELPRSVVFISGSKYLWGIRRNVNQMSDN